MNSDNYNLILFKEISKFTNDLCNIFGNKSHSLKLYNRLVYKTTIAHDTAIKKHINIFKKFCNENLSAILNKDLSKFKNTLIEYSPRVFIDLNFLFTIADDESTKTLWDSLSSLSSLLEPSTNAKEILNNEKQKNVNEAEFLTDIISKVDKYIKPDESPMDAVTKILNSGVFSDIITGMNTKVETGNLDLSKLMETVQNMCSSIEEMKEPKKSKIIETAQSIIKMKEPEIIEKDLDLDEEPEIIDEDSENLDSESEKDLETENLYDELKTEILD